MPFLLKLAWQDLRGSGQSLWVLCACLVLGVTLVATTGGLYRQVQQGLKADSRQIAGLISSNRRTIFRKLPAKVVRNS